MIRNVLEYLERSAERFPAKTAVRIGRSSVTYRELLLNSRRIGTCLADPGKEGLPVGVFMEKSIEALTGFFGIVYAGRYYTLMNPEFPDTRLRELQNVLEAEVILTTEDKKERAQALFSGAKILTVSEMLTSFDPSGLIGEQVHSAICGIDMKQLQKIRERSIDTDPLYINFTSGSTGVPKGIVVSHRSVIDFMECFVDLFSIESEDVIANQAPFDFDVSVKDIYSAMKSGATLVLVPKESFSKPADLMDLLCENHVTTLIWSVSALCLVSTFHGLEYRRPDSIRRVLFSGEVMPLRHLERWRASLPDAMYVNLYGPTEITCNCTYHILEKGRDYSDGIPIGKHFPNEDVVLLDEKGERISAPGVKGMIGVRGTALALGYYRAPEKNAERFGQNPLQSRYPERMYQTGDLGMLNENGEMLFCGRLDHQVKYMGHRIELEEIEGAMAGIDGVERCFCDFDEKRSQLKGYYTGSLEKSELYEALRLRLPVYMIPGFLRKLPEMPLTKNGKIDRRQACACA